MKDVIKKSVFGLFCLLFILPGLQKKFGLIDEKPLKGYQKPEAKPAFNLDSIVSLGYQLQYEKYLDDHIGFRNFAIRSYNQLHYSLFKTAHARDVVVGKNHYLYEKNYILNYLGMNFRGEEHVKAQTEKLKFIQDTLDKLGVKLLVVFAPGKASFFPEYFPEKYASLPKTRSNYDAYTFYCQQKAVRHLDINRMFRQLKGKTPYPIMTNAGIHWTVYGMTLAVDTLAAFMEQESDFRLPAMIVEHIELSDSARDTDYDIADGLNLLFPLPHPQYAYPRLAFRKDEKTKCPGVVTIADSYYWNIFGSGIASQLFDDSWFWFYNREAWHQNGSGPFDVSSLNVKEEIEKRDFVILLVTDANLHSFPWGFADMMYAIYQGLQPEIDLSETADLSLRIAWYAEMLKKDSDFMAEAVRKAKKTGVNADTLIMKEAKKRVRREIF